MRRRASALLATVTLGLVLLAGAGFSSADPDGLERVAADLGFAAAAEGPAFETLADYRVEGIDGGASSALAGLIGVAIVSGGVMLVGRRLQRRRIAP